MRRSSGTIEFKKPIPPLGKMDAQIISSTEKILRDLGRSNPLPPSEIEEVRDQLVDGALSETLQVLQIYITKGDMFKFVERLPDFLAFVPELLLHAIKVQKNHFITYLLGIFPPGKKLSKDELGPYTIALQTLLQNRNPCAFDFFQKIFDETNQKELLQKIKFPPYSIHTVIKESNEQFANPEFDYIQLLNKEKISQTDLIENFFRVIQSKNIELIKQWNSSQLFILSFDSLLKEQSPQDILFLINSLEKHSIPSETLATLIQDHEEWLNQNPELLETLRNLQEPPISTSGFC